MHRLIEKVYAALKLLLMFIPWERILKKWSVLVVDPAISVLNKHFTVPIENVPSMRDSHDRCFETFLKVLFALAGPAPQLAIAAMSFR